MFHCYTTTHVNLTSRYLAVPGQGFPPRALLLTAILHLAFPSHLPLTTASDCVDMHGGFVFRSESGQTALPSVLPQRAFSILITPAGQRSSILPSRHTMTVSITKKKEKDSTIDLNTFCVLFIPLFLVNKWLLFFNAYHKTIMTLSGLVHTKVA